MTRTPKSKPIKTQKVMKATRQHQVRLNGNLVFQYDHVTNDVGNIINTIYNTLIITGHKYTKEWKKEEQGGYVWDILEIQVTA